MIEGPRRGKLTGDMTRAGDARRVVIVGAVRRGAEAVSSHDGGRMAVPVELADV